MVWERWGSVYTPENLDRRAAALAAQPAVLYGETSGSGRYAPLQCLYSDASGSLLTTHPSSSSTEFVSRYCPSCLRPSAENRMCSDQLKESFCPAIRARQNIIGAANKNLQHNETSGSTIPSCHFSGSQLVDHPKTTTP